MRSEQCDIIHIHNFSQFVPITRFFNRRAKIVLHMNCDWLSQFDSGLVDSRLRYADAILGCAEYITNRVRVRFPQHARRCLTMYNGADITKFSNSIPRDLNQERPTRFIFVGRISPEKGLHVLIDAFRTVYASRQKIELRVVGSVQMPPLSFIVEQSKDPIVQGLRRFYSSDYLRYLQDQAKALPGDIISFTGFVSHSGLAHCLQTADIFVQPSIWGEPFPLSVLEAMAAGLPVVSSRAGGLPESIVDKETGLLVEPNNVNALANAMLRLANDKTTAHRMGIAGATRAMQLFSWEVVVKRLESLYEALVSGRSINSALLGSFHQ
jgi:glycosyltransferase involved in cell wall biosynthesis